MKKFLGAVALFAIFAAVLVYATTGERPPPLKDGDLIFQTSTSSQSAAILIATLDPYTHMGIIKHEGDDIVVIEAGGRVKETPLKEWVNRGVLKRVAIDRDPDLTQEQAD